MYGKVDFTAKTPKIIQLPGVLPAVYKTKGKTILNFNRCPGCKLRALGFAEADMSEPEPVEYDPKTEKLEKKWVVESGKIKVAYEKVKIIADKQVK